MSNISHEPCTLLGSGLLQFSVIPITGVCRSAADDETGLEDFGLGSKTDIVDEVGFGCDGIRKRLEVNRRCGHFLLCGLNEQLHVLRRIGANIKNETMTKTHVVSVSKVTTIGKTQTHKAVIWLD